MGCVAGGQICTDWSVIMSSDQCPVPYNWVTSLFYLHVPCYMCNCTYYTTVCNVETMLTTFYCQLNNVSIFAFIWYRYCERGWPMYKDIYIYVQIVYYRQTFLLQEQIKFYLNSKHIFRVFYWDTLCILSIIFGVGGIIDLHSK